MRTGAKRLAGTARRAARLPGRIGDWPVEALDRVLSHSGIGIAAASEKWSRSDPRSNWNTLASRAGSLVGSPSSPPITRSLAVNPPVFTKPSEVAQHTALAAFVVRIELQRRIHRQQRIDGRQHRGRDRLWLRPSNTDAPEESGDTQPSGHESASTQLKFHRASLTVPRL